MDMVGAYCCRHGMDFMNAALTRAGLNNGQNGEAVSHSSSAAMSALGYFVAAPNRLRHTDVSRQRWAEW